MIQIALDPNGDTCSAKLVSYLGRDKFPLFRNACVAAGAVYVPSTKENRLPVDALGTFLAELSKVSLPFEVDSRISEALEADAAKATALLEKGRDRVEKAKERLAPAGLAPFRYQETGIEWIAPRKSALLLDDMGLGKTVQALLALPEDAPVVIVVPTGVRASWKAEIKRWVPGFEVSVPKSKKLFVWPEAGEIVLATYTTIPTAATELPAPAIGTVLVADEIHYAKNKKAARSKNLAALVDVVLAHDGATWGLTGTPLLNRPQELWSLFQLLGLAEKAFGTWSNFVRLFGGHKGSYGYSWDGSKPELEEKVAVAMRQVALRRMKRDVLKDLPAKRRVFRSVNGLDKGTVALADKLVADLEAAGVDLNDDKFLAKAGKVAFEQMSAARKALANAKIPAMIELVESYEDAEEPVVVFSCHRGPVEVLGQREGWATILGDTPSDKRGEIIEKFQRGELKGIAGTVRAMGVGVTLTAASHMIFVDLDWTPANNSQAEDRICRIGQTADSLLITVLNASHPLDNRVNELIDIKLRYIDTVNAAAVQEDYTGESPAEELAKAAEAAKASMVDLEAKAKADAEKAEEEKAEKQKAAKKAVKARLGDAHDGREEVVVSDDGRFRGPCNAIEDHAMEALITLSGLDDDRASEQNGVGFNGTDTDFGNSLAESLNKFGRLSDKQWGFAVKIVKKYHRQIGKAPVAV
jgi:SWI/SNF-related matrix-associated actin-dependent regulator 1 of chromatin subfamily A